MRLEFGDRPLEINKYKNYVVSHLVYIILLSI